jgi:formylglycine-generating enzyme required for sulfatase activity
MTQSHKVTGTNPAVFWLFIVLFLILVVTVTTVVFVVAPAQDLERTTQATAVARLAAVEQHYAAGLAYAQAGDWPAAEDAFRQVIALDANYQDVQAQFQAASAQALAGRYARGVGMMNLGRWAEAEQLLQEVFDVDPDYQAVQPLLGTVTANLAVPTPTPAPPTLTPTPTVMPTPTPTPTPDQPAAGAVRTIGDLTFVYVPAGEFLMGSTDAQVEAAIATCVASGYPSCARSRFMREQPQHTVFLDAYWIGQTEVTNAQYQAFVDAGGYATENLWSAAGWTWRSERDRTEPGCWDNDAFNAPAQPVVCVFWYEAEAYANWLAGRTGERISLPSEAQWEKAARGADGRIYPWGDDFDGTWLNYCDVNCTAEWRDERFDDGVGHRTAAVGSYPAGASPYGALDMAGNVWEWTADWYAADYYAASPTANPTGPTSGDDRVVRGGSWYQPSALSSVAARSGGFDLVNLNAGFRVVCAASP